MPDGGHLVSDCGRGVGQVRVEGSGGLGFAVLGECVVAAFVELGEVIVVAAVLAILVLVAEGDG